MKVCKKCRAQMDDEMLFCTTCGAKLPVNSNGQNNDRKWLVIIPIVVVAFLMMMAVIGGGYYFIQHYKKPGSGYDSESLAEIAEKPSGQEEYMQLNISLDSVAEVDDIIADSVVAYDDSAIGAFNVEDDEDDIVEEPRRPSNHVFDVVEEMPQYPGGNAALMEFLGNNIKYPVVAEENGIQGRVVVTFVIERDGSVTDVKVEKSVDPSLDKEAIRVVKSMPRWIPGKQDGSPVRVKYTMPVTFKLQ